MKCKNCSHNQFYQLQDQYIKCKKCAKKYSLKKINKEISIIKSFCDNKTALETSKELNLDYKSIKNKYDEFRYLLAKYLENEYNNSIKDYSQYEEYYYFTQRQKAKKTKSIYDAINIIGFYSNNKIYTLLMPRLRKTNDKNSDNSFEKYLNWRKIESDRFKNHEIKAFWSFLDESLKKYKGINNDNFFYYLKESEFKYNYKYAIQIEILNEIIFSQN